MLTRRHLVLAAAAALLLVPGPQASAKELSGVNMADSVQAGEKKLVLNGLGMRKKAIFKVYVGGLYLEAASKDANAILAADAGKAIRLHFLRDIEKAKMIEAFKEGFEGNAGAKATAQKANIDKFLAITPDVKSGNEWTFVYVVGKGTSVMHGDKESLLIEGKEFADALFSIWLGPKPPSDDLKKGMLGN